MSGKMIGMVLPRDYLSIQDGASQRIKADIAALTSRGYNVEAIFPSSVSLREYNFSSKLTLATYPNIQRAKFLPEDLRIPIDMYTQMLNPFFRSVLKKRCGQYSVILAHTPWSAAASYKVVRNSIPLVYVAHNFEYGLAGQITRTPLIPRLTHYVEKYVCQKVTKILCVSECDMKALEVAYDIPQARLALLPNTVDIDFFSRTHILYDKVAERQKLGLAPSSLVLLFPGRMSYVANLDALKFILDKLVPASRAVGIDIRFIVAGARIPKSYFDYRNGNVSFYSDVSDMRRFLSVADAVIVPICIGGGTRLKILESFAAGVPVISTAKGAEGIDCQDGCHILIAQNDVSDFINKIKMLAENKSLKQKLKYNAYELVAQKYSVPVASRFLQEIITEVEDKVELKPRFPTNCHSFSCL